MIIKADKSQAQTPFEGLELAELVALAEPQGDGLAAEAARVVAEAKRQAERIRREAAEQGYEEGRREARAEAVRREAERWATIEPALAEAVEQVHHAKQAWLRHWEKAAIGTATAIARRVLRRELAKQPDVPVELAREALELAAGSEQVRVLLNPDDHRALADRVESLAATMSTLGAVEVTADEAITPGGCRVETRHGTIDQQFEAQLARIEQELA